MLGLVRLLYFLHTSLVTCSLLFCASSHFASLGSQRLVFIFIGQTYSYLR